MLTNKIKKYDKYKDSGIPWIGEIPESWELIKWKFIVNYKKGKNPTVFYDNSISDGLPYLSMDYLRGYNPIPNYSKYEKGLVVVKDGDMLLLWDGSNAGEFIIGKYGFLSSTMVKLNVKKNYNLRYFYYHSKFIERLLKDFTIGMGIPHINGEVLDNLCYLKLGNQEQQAIADFLDKKTAQIDMIIERRKKQIELLKEKRVAIINKAVTKGLDDSVKMKDSGIEWIGEIPEHWVVRKLKSALEVLTDYTANGSFGDLAKNVTYLDKGYSRVVRLTDLRVNLENEDGIFIDEFAHKFLKKSELFGGEILIANVGHYTGYVCKMPRINFKATLGPNMYLLKFKKNIYNDYLYYLLMSDFCNKELILNATSTAQPKLNKENTKTIYIFIFSIEEQKSIAKYLDNKNAQIDGAIEKLEKSLGLFEEYKKSLISNVVTGKIKVF